MKALKINVGRQASGYTFRLHPETKQALSRAEANEHPASSLFVAALLLIAGCGASSETAVVTERPPPDTTRAAPVAGTDSDQPLPVAPAGYDTVQARRFDQGRMWTFDDPPTDYFSATYDFDSDSAWFREARLGALRFSDYCSASFVSPRGLVLTSHHCARESIAKVSEEDEELLENGFYAEAASGERKVPDLHVEQLIGIEDVTERITGRAEQYADDQERAQALRQRAERVQEKMTQAAKELNERRRVEVVELYSGARYAAYTLRRYKDVRLAFAPELRAAFFGGEADNFTYPRYALDVAFFRVYDENGEPLRSPDYFPWSVDGASEGDAVFVVGNPGSTSRLKTVSQLRYERDYTLQQQLRVLRTRADLLANYVEANPEEAEEHDLKNALFSIRNSIKAQTGQLEGLRDPYLLARRGAAERQLARAFSDQDSLRRSYVEAIRQLQAVQRSKEAIADQSGAFTYFGAPSFSSHVLTRALYGYYSSTLKRRGAPPERLDEIRKQVMDVSNWPAALEADLIAARLRELRDHLGAGDPTVEKLLGERSPEGVGERLANRTALTDSSAFRDLLDEGYLQSDDPTVPVIQALAPLYLNLGRQSSEYASRESRLQARIARARLVEYGPSRVPPDATFSLRISDGRVEGYEYNGTRAAAHTSFFGMYDHFYSYGEGTPWDLPERWRSPPSDFDRNAELNIVSTNDIMGGNSGSPLLNRDLEIVGVAFDGNIESLASDYIYLPERMRAVSVDVRGMREALDTVYDADRLVLELMEGRFVESEERADALAR